MESIQKHLPRSNQQLIHSSRQSDLSKVQPIDDNRLAEIIKIIIETEQVKEITLSNDQRSALAKELYRLNWSLDKLRIQSDIVKRSDTYGKIALEFWMKDIPVFTYTELRRFVDKEIERRRNIAIDSGINHEQILKQGLAEVFQELQSQYYDALDKKKDELRKEVKELGQIISILPEKYQRSLLKKANEKGFLIKDPHWRMSLKYIIPKIIEDARILVSTARKDKVI